MARRKKVRRRRHRFRPGDFIFEPATNKFFRIERINLNLGTRYLLRSIESGNPGNPKIAEFLDLQIEDGYYQRLTPREFKHATE